MNASYQGIKYSYQGMKDSIAESNKAKLAHEKVRQKVIDGFKTGLNKRMYATFDSLIRCSTSREMNRFRQIYITEVYDFYNSYSKIAKGEDLTAELNALLQANLEESQVLFNTEFSRVWK